MDSVFEICIQTHWNCKSIHFMAAKHTRNRAIVFFKSPEKRILITVVCGTQCAEDAGINSFSVMSSVAFPQNCAARAALYNLLTSVLHTDICVLCTGRSYTCILEKKCCPFL